MLLLRWSLQLLLAPLAVFAALVVLLQPLAVLAALALNALAVP